MFNCMSIFIHYQANLCINCYNLKKGKNMLLLRTLRNEKGVTQSVVANAIGVERYTYAKWEQGRAEPCISDIVKLLKMHYKNKKQGLTLLFLIVLFVLFSSLNARLFALFSQFFPMLFYKFHITCKVNRGQFANHR